MRWVLVGFTLPWALTTWLLGLLSIVLWLAHRPRIESGILTLELREWFASGRDERGPWRYSTTLGRVIWFQPQARAEPDSVVWRHELIHVWQVEDLMVLGALVGLVVGLATGDWWLALGLWWSAGLWQIPNFATALLRFGPRGIYRDSLHERSAYAQASRWSGGSSWWDYREAQREQQKGLLS
jgi:hypothetical protein